MGRLAGYFRLMAAARHSNALNAFNKRMQFRFVSTWLDHSKSEKVEHIIS